MIGKIFHAIGPCKAKRRGGHRRTLRAQMVRRDTEAAVVDGAASERFFHQAGPKKFVARFARRNVRGAGGLRQPTQDSIVRFCEPLEPSGILICDNDSSGNYPGARGAMDEFFPSGREGTIELPFGQALCVKRA